MFVDQAGVQGFQLAPTGAEQDLSVRLVESGLWVVSRSTGNICGIVSERSPSQFSAFALSGRFVGRYLSFDAAFLSLAA